MLNPGPDLLLWEIAAASECCFRRNITLTFLLALDIFTAAHMQMSLQEQRKQRHWRRRPRRYGVAARGAGEMTTKYYFDTR